MFEAPLAKVGIKVYRGHLGWDDDLTTRMIGQGLTKVWHSELAELLICGDVRLEARVCPGLRSRHRDLNLKEKMYQPKMDKLLSKLNQ